MKHNSSSRSGPHGRSADRRATGAHTAADSGVRAELHLALGMLAIVFPGSALAYVGPGAGLTAIGSAIALVGAILLGIVGFVWYPVKRLLRKRSRARERDEPDSPPGRESDGQPEKMDHP